MGRGDRFVGLHCPKFRASFAKISTSNGRYGRAPPYRPFLTEIFLLFIAVFLCLKNFSVFYTFIFYTDTGTGLAATVVPLLGVLAVSLLNFQQQIMASLILPECASLEEDAARSKNNTDACLKVREVTKHRSTRDIFQIQSLYQGQYSQASSLATISTVELYSISGARLRTNESR